MNEAELLEHCQTILKSRRIQGKPVILCEGDLRSVQGRRSPQTYRRLEQIPDANFYKACIPSNWTQRIPTFFNCGGRSSVIATYFGLQELHEQDPLNSYLNPDQLFAFVDLDIQNANLSDDEYDYPWHDCHQVFADLYEQCCICQDAITQHRIWPTGLIHKEAYFLIPALQELFDQQLTQTLDVNGQPLNLMALYAVMAQALLSDAEVEKYWDCIRDRATHCQNLDCSTPENWKTAWLREFQDSETGEPTKEELAYALLSLRKAKSYWEALKPDENWTRSLQNYRDQLTLEIGRWYSRNYEDPRNHISFLLHCLHQSYGLSSD